MSDVVERAVVEIGFDDKEVEAGLDALKAKTKRDMAAISRERAIVNVKYNIEDARKNLKEAAALEQALADKVKEREQNYKKADAASKGGLKAALNRAEAELKAQQANTAALKKHQDELGNYLTTYKRWDQQEALSDKARTRYAKNRAAEWKQEQRDLTQGLDLQKRYLDAKEKALRLEKASQRAQGSDVLRARLDSTRALADMVKLRRELAAMGQDPIKIDAKVDPSTLRKVGEFFGFVDNKHQGDVKSLSDKISGLAKSFKETNVNIGPINLALSQLLVGAAALAPVITGLVGALGSLVSVTGSGLVGALGVGAAGMTGFGLAATGMFTAFHPLMQQFQLGHTYVQKYNLAMAKYSANSKQGKQATAIFNHEMKSLPPVVADAIKAFHEISGEWQKLTGSNTNKQVGSIISSTLKTVKADLGFFAKDTNQAFTNVAGGWGKLMATLRSNGAQQGLDTIFQNFNKTIPTLADAFSHLMAAIGPVLVNFSKYLPKIATGFDDWAKGAEAASNKSGGFAKGVDTSMHSLEQLGHFLYSATRFLITFFKAGVQPGGKFVDEMTASLDKLNGQMDTVAGQTKLTNFYSRSIQTTKELWNALLPLVSAFVQFSQAVAPLATVGLTLVSWFTKFVSVAASFQPFKYFGGFLLGVTIIGRLTSALREGVTAAGQLATRVAAIGSAKLGGAGWKDAFSSTSSSAKAASIIEEAELSGHTRGAEIVRAAIISGFAAGAPVAAEEIATAEKAGAVGGVPSIVGGKGAGKFGKFAGKASTAFGIAGVGILGSQLLGDAIGGKGGTAVSNIGSGASGGAALGSFFGPEGTVAGAFVGALGAGLLTFVQDDSVKQNADKFAKNFTKPFAKDVQDAFAPKISKAVQDAKNFDNSVQKSPGTPNQFHTAAGAPSHVLDPAQQKISNEKWAKAGRLDAQAYIADFSKAKFPTAFAFTQDAFQRLSAMKPQMRVAGGEALLSFAAGMVAKKQMTIGQYIAFQKALQAKVPGLVNYLKQQGEEGAKNMANAFKFTQAKNALSGALEDLRNKWRLYNIDKDVNGKNLTENTVAAMHDLKRIMKTGTKEQREAAMAEYKKLQKEAEVAFTQMGEVVSARIGNMRDKIASGSHQAAQAAEANFGQVASSVGRAMSSGALSAQQGAKIIGDALNAMLTAFGQSKIPLTGLSAKEIVDWQKTWSHGATQSMGPGHFAEGGRVPGPVGPDNWTLVDPGGRPAAKVGGSEILVTNRHTERRVDQMLAPYGTSLGREVAGERTPHFATGGTTSITGRVSTFGPPTEGAGTTATGVSDTNPGLALRIPGTSYGDSRNEALKGHMFHVTINGHSGNLPDIDIGPNESTGRNIDVTGAGARVLGFDPFSFPTDAIGTATSTTGPISGAGAGGSAGAVPNMPEVKVSGMGTVSKAVRAGLKKVTDAANKYIMAHMPQPTVGSGGGAGPTFAPTSGPIPAQVQWALSAARTIANEHLPYETNGAGWGFPGYDCSGYVSTVMDAAGIWPKWAYYTAANPINAHTDPGPGKYITIGTFGHDDSGPHDHTMMSIMGNYFESGMGHGPSQVGGWSMNFDRYGHPHGFARGGRLRGVLGEPGYQPEGKLLRDLRAGKHPGLKNGKEPHFAGAFANGGAFTTNGPTVGLFGEGGRKETVIAIPHAATGERITHRERAVPRHPNYAELFKPRDRIGGIGTGDLDTARDAAKAAFQNYFTKIHQPKTIKVQEPTTSTSTTRGWTTDSHGHRRPKYSKTVHHGFKTVTKKQSTDGTPAEKAKAHKLYLHWKHLEKMDTEAQDYIQKFTNLESQISNVGTYMDEANSSPSDMAWGYDPKTGKKTKKKWKDWKKDLVGLERQHVGMLQRAANDIKRDTTGDDRPGSIAYVRAIQGALGSAQSSLHDTISATDQNAPVAPGKATSVDDLLASMPPGVAKQLERLNLAFTLAPEGSQGQKDIEGQIVDLYKGVFAYAKRVAPNNIPLLTDVASALSGAEQTFAGITPLSGATAASPEDYMTLLGGDWSNRLARLNYAVSSAAGNNVPDDPGTSAREDLASLGDDLSAAKDLMDFYNSLFSTAKADPTAAGNYGLLTSLSDAFNGALGTWQGLSQQFTDAGAANGPTQPALFTGARQSLYDTYGSNVGTIAQSLQGGASVASSVVSAANAQPARNVTVHNHYQTPPEDPHSWSQGLSWELDHAI